MIDITPDQRTSTITAVWSDRVEDALHLHPQLSIAEAIIETVKRSERLLRQDGCQFFRLEESTVFVGYAILNFITSQVAEIQCRKQFLSREPEFRQILENYILS